MDLIRKFLSTEEEKRLALQEQATHIRTGLTKLLETQEQVANLNKEMVIKGEVLKNKDIEANLKLNQMVEKQNEAEQGKVIAEKLAVDLQKQNEQIAIRKKSVETELSEAEPTLLAAKSAVGNIKKAQLDEVRALGKPPLPVKMTMEMVCIMLGEEKVSDWGDVRKFVKKDDFITTVVNFDSLRLTPAVIKVVQDKYLSSTDIDQAKVDNASKACGPLYMWAGSQIKYALILRNIKPLRDEVAGLIEKSREAEVGREKALKNVEDLESAIKQYKTDYAIAIRDTELIRTEMTVVTKRVARASSLLASLEEEKVRWAATSQSFDDQMSTLVGDNLLAAAFLTYGGIFDQKVRKRLLSEWSDTLENMGIPFCQDLDLVAHLSNSADHLQWRDYGLPLDDLALQNAILLERFNRYPLIVDPSGQATNFITNKYAGQKMVNI